MWALHFECCTAFVVNVPQDMRLSGEVRAVFT